MKKLLYINNELVDLYPGTVIAQTIQAFELGALGSVRTNYTNQIRIPQTGHNRQILQFSENSKSNTAFPYTSYSARYVENGIEIIRNGRVILKESGGEYLLTILSGPVNFFDFIANKKLWDLDTTSINTGWSDTIRDGIRNTTTGMVAPFVDDGIAVYNGALPAIEHDGGVTKHPWIYYHTVIDKIFSSAGYTKSGAIFSDPAYLKMAMPLNLDFSKIFIDAKSFHVAAPGTQVIVNPTSYTDITFNQVGSNGSDGFYNGTSAYVVSNADTAATYFNMAFRAAVTITVAGGTVNMIIARNNFPDININLSSGTPITAVGSGTHYLSGSASGLKDGDAVSVRVITNSGAPTVTVTTAIFEGNVIRNTLATGYNYFNHLFDDISQIDFLKDFSVRFNVKMIERNGVIICKTMNEILADKANMLDWTDKQIPGTEKLRYAYSGVAQTNTFDYESDQYTSDLSDAYASGSFTVANENLSEAQTIYSSMFTMSDMIMFANRINVASIPVGASVPSLGLRLCMLRQNLSGEPTIYYNGVGRTDYKVAYFIDARYTYSMHWQYFIDGYYADFVTKLQKAKAITRRYRLNDLDIHTFDQLKLVHDSGETFIVTKINNYVSGKSVEVELFKVD